MLTLWLKIHHAFFEPDSQHLLNANDVLLNPPYFSRTLTTWQQIWIASSDTPNAEYHNHALSITNRKLQL